jgi:DNA polymerase IV
MNRTILHVDMDAFYASVEQRDHPDFRGKPVIVGADPKGGRGRGIVATCSYEARRFGVHSAQPISEAWRRCPEGIYVPPDMRKYARASTCIMEILRSFSDALEQISIDEAFLDVTGSRRLLGSGPEIGAEIKSRIRQEQGLTASVGVAANKFVAKVASDLRKPDGLVIVEPGTEKQFLAPLPVGRLWGVGAKTEAVFHGIGLKTVGQIASLGREELIRLLGKSGESAWELAHGLDDRAVVPEEGYKSIGHETTFEVDTSDPEVLHDTLLYLTGKMTARLRSNGMMARTIAIKFRESDFTTYTRRTTLDEPIDTEERAFPVALKLMNSLVRKGVAVRLIGVYGSNLVDGPAGQMKLFQEGPRKDRKIAAALDDINRRYGRGAITRAAVVSLKRHEED